VNLAWSRALLAALLVLPSSALLAPARARAQLAVAPTQRCAVQERLPPVNDALDPPSVEVDVTGEAGRWRATLRVRYANGSEGTRRITARSCAQLQLAVAVTLSLLDAAAPLPQAAEEGSAGVPTRATTPPAAVARATAADEPHAEPARAAPVAISEPAAPVDRPLWLPAPAFLPAGSADAGTVAVRPAERRPLRGFVRASSLLAMAGTRFGELGAALGGGAWLGAWGARVELSARRPLARLAAAHDFTLELRRYAAALEPCVRSGGALELSVCGGPQLELIHGLALGPSQPASDLVWLPGLGAGSWLRLPLSSRWALSAELKASWSLRQAQASVAPWGAVYELPRLSVGLLLGAEWAL
jgi:hypothetical protein